MRKILGLLIIIAAIVAVTMPVKATARRNDPLQQCVDGAYVMYNYEFYQCQLMNPTTAEQTAACFASAEHTRDTMVSECYRLYY